jgi:hypothetical protein
MYIELLKGEMELIITVLEYAVEYYDGEASLSDMVDLGDKLEACLIEE